MFLGVDVGGTFTDAVLVQDDGTLHTAKVASTPAEQSQGVLAAVRAVLARAHHPAERVERFSHGMTVATNALLEGRTARTALVATAGFTDVIELARQARVHLYRLSRAAPAPLVEDTMRFAAPERMGPHGPLEPLDPLAASELAQRVAASEPEAVAVALLHSYADDTHERMLERALRELLPDAQISLSSDLVGTFREYERTATTVLDAALSPLLGRYLTRLCDAAADVGLCAPQIMQSSGGLTDVGRAAAHAALTVLSGPAGGVGGAQLLARLAGEPRVLCFDMGGTSCDVCVIDDAAVPETAERTIAGRPLALAALDIHTVGAGGGSIAWRDAGGALRVGPLSAGADPGPACYGRGGTLPTVTDANLVLGRLLEDAPLADDVKLDRAGAERAVGGLAEEVGLGVLACAEGIVRVAEAQMLAALRVMTVERGIDPRDFALMSFGGAGPLHAASLARALGISHVLCPRACGVLSALGLAAAAPRRERARTLGLGAEELSAERLQRERATLAAEAAAQLPEPPVRIRVVHELRYRGQSFELGVEEELDGGAAQQGISPAELRERFELAHEQRYGYRDERAAIELVTMRASAWGSAPALRPLAAGGSLRTERARALVFDGRAHRARVFSGEPAAGARLAPATLCALPESTLLVPPGWSATVDDFGTIHLRAETPA